ncbi:MAG: TRAP transporter substrate-binding protein DctP [Thermotogaceae bacterium]|nr:TRAP transporter substrate-binding protein DctP [Thermotogaceae bacterium]
MRRMKLVSVFLLVSLILLGGSVFSEVPEISLEEILKWTSAETNEDPYKRENMEVRGFYRDGEEYEDPQFYYFAASAASSREGDEPVEAVDGFYREGEEEEEYSIFISAFTSAPVDDIKVEAMKVFASTVNTLSGGDIYVRIFHTNNHSPEELLSNVINGTEVMAFDCSLSTIADLLFLPELSIFSAAYLFEDAEHMDKAMESGIMTELLDRVAANSRVRVLDNWYSGSHHLFLNETISGIEDPSQLEGLRLCSSCYQGSFDACKALGASPVYMGQSTLEDAMSCGSIQGAEMLLECVTAEECIDSIKTIILTGHQIESVNPTISEATWKRLSEEQRGWILEALHTARSYMETEVLAHEAGIIGELAQKYGVQVLIPCKDGLLQQAATYYSQNRFSAVWGEDAYVRMHSASEGM